MHSIRLKITALTLAAILASIVVLGGLGLMTIGIQSDRSSAAEMQMIADLTAREMDGYLNSLQQSVEMAVNIAEDSLEGLDPAALLKSNRTAAELDALDAAMSEHCGHVEHAFTAIAENTSGIVTYYYCVNSDLGSGEHGFFFSSLGSDSFMRREPLLSYELDPADTEHTTWYYTPIETGHALWLGPYLAHYLGEAWTVSYVAPIYSGDVLLVVLGMDILLSTMTRQIEDTKVYETGFVTLLDAEGNILYHPSLKVYATPEQASEALDAALFAGESSGGEMIRYTKGREERVCAFATLSNGMKVVVIAPVKEVNAGQRELGVLLVLATVVLLMVFSAITIVEVRNVTDPLRRLAAAARELGRGNYDAALPPEGKDEVGELTAAFQRMREHMKHTFSDLNSLAYTDALTGVKNKAAFDVSVDLLDEAICRDGADTRFACVIFDCNRLKRINDAHGHEFGDIYLRTASEVLAAVYARSTVFRIGGDEFAVLLQGEDYAERGALLRKFDRRAEAVNAAAKQPWETVSLSRGMAEFVPGADADVLAVLRRADQRMYEDKRQFKQSAGESAEAGEA